MPTKSDFLDSLRFLVERAEIEENEKERLLSLLTETEFAVAELADISKIAGIVEAEKIRMEREISESGDPDLINEMSDMVEALENIEYESAVKSLEELNGQPDMDASQKKSGLSLLDTFAGL